MIEALGIRCPCNVVGCLYVTTTPPLQMERRSKRLSPSCEKGFDMTSATSSASQPTSIVLCMCVSAEKLRHVFPGRALHGSKSQVRHKPGSLECSTCLLESSEFGHELRRSSASECRPSHAGLIAKNERMRGAKRRNRIPGTGHVHG